MAILAQNAGDPTGSWTAWRWETINSIRAPISAREGHVHTMVCCGLRRARMRSQRRLQAHDDVLWHDVRALLGADAPFHFCEVLVVIVDALALSPPDRPRWAIVTPFALPGEISLVE